jgi:hypothetical protein
MFPFGTSVLSLTSGSWIEAGAGPNRRLAVAFKTLLMRGTLELS